MAPPRLASLRPSREVKGLPRWTNIHRIPGNHIRWGHLQSTNSNLAKRARPGSWPFWALCELVRSLWCSSVTGHVFFNVFCAPGSTFGSGGTAGCPCFSCRACIARAGSLASTRGGIPRRDQRQRDGQPSKEKEVQEGRAEAKPGEEVDARPPGCCCGRRCFGRPGASSTRRGR